MGELRFEGRVAIVTGAGANPGLGRAYAMLLAERGAKVVVNDLGGGPDGRGVQPVMAAEVVREINDLGGTAVADTGSVADRDSARAIAATALEAFGTVDVLINNAGINIPALFSEIDSADIQRTLDVHLMGTVWMCRAVWPHMSERGYGRIVNVSSSVALGLRRLVHYGTAKAGVLGLTRGLAIEGADHGILVNSISPGAGTASTSYISQGEEATVLMGLTPEQVAPTAAYLAHERCTVTGRHLTAVGGHVAELYIAETAGVDGALTPEAVGDRIDAICDRAGGAPVADPTVADAANAWQPRPYIPPR